MQSINRWFVLGAFIVLIALPPFLFSPDIRERDFPRSGEIVRVTETGFVIVAKRTGQEIVIDTTASTSIEADIRVGQFVQVVGDMADPHYIVAERVQAIKGPKNGHEFKLQP